MSLALGKWVRQGECNHCGWCCENLGRFEIAVSNPDRRYLEVRGAALKNNVLVIQGDFCAPCPQHVDGRCGIYEERPATCSAFPSEPNEIIRTPCSYWFDNGETKLGGKGSPYPSTDV